MKRFLIVILTFALVCNAAQARKVTGTVQSGKEKLSGVIVTDGKNFTETRKGKFAFDIEDDSEFVFIVTPAGYTADFSSGVPAFYIPADGCSKFNFELQKLGEAGDYSLIAVGDPQCKTEKQFKKFAGKPLQDICETAKGLENVAAGIILGDICWDDLTYLARYKKEIVRTGIPFYPVVGNHDHDRELKGDIETTGPYRKEMGPDNYAFFMGKDVVLSLDNIIYDTQKKYVEGYAPHVLQWVKGLMEHIPSDAVLYIAQHSPTMHWDRENKFHPGADELFDIIRGHTVYFVSGHTHINNNHNYGDNMYEHNVAALCGAWWDTKHCADGTPRGYKVYTKEDGRLSWYYKSVDYPKDFQVEIFDLGQTQGHPDSIVVNVWDWDELWKIEWWQDGVKMGTPETVYVYSPLYQKEIGDVFTGKAKEMPKYKKPRLNYHYFAVTPSKSAEKVNIRIESRFGEKWEYEIDLKK